MSRADISAGKAHVELYVKNSKFMKGLNSASKQLTSFGKDLTKIGATFAAAGAGVLGVLSTTVSVASDMEEQMNKFNVVFGESASEMRKWADTTGKALGRSSLQMVTFLGSTQDLLVPMGFAADRARTLSKEMATLAIDVASFNNAADEDVLRDFHAALTGSGEVMKKYGVIVSEAAVKQQLLSEGLDPKNVTESQKAMARWTLIVQGTSAAAGDATRSAGSYANQMKALTAAVTDAKIAIGEQLLPIITPFVSRAKEAVAVIRAWIKGNGSYAASVAIVAAKLLALGSAVIGIGAVFAGAGSIIGAFTFAVGTAATGVGLLVSAFLLLGTPLGMITLGVTSLTIGFFTATEAGDKAAARMKAAFWSVASVWKSTMGGITEALTSGEFALAFEIAAQGLKAAFLLAFAEIEIAFRDMATAMLNDIIDIWSTVSRAVGGVAGGEITRRLGELAKDVVFEENRQVAKERRKGAAKAGKVLFKLTEQAAGPGRMQAATSARSAEIESVRDATSRMSDPDAVVMAQNAAIRQAEAQTNQRISAWMAANAPSMMVAESGGSREQIKLLAEQNQKLSMMLAELRMGRAVYE